MELTIKYCSWNLYIQLDSWNIVDLSSDIIISQYQRPKIVM